MNPPPTCDKCGEVIKAPPFVYSTDSRKIFHAHCHSSGQIADNPGRKGKKTKMDSRAVDSESRSNGTDTAT